MSLDFSVATCNIGPRESYAGSPIPYVKRKGAIIAELKGIARPTGTVGTPGVLLFQEMTKVSQPDVESALGYTGYGNGRLKGTDDKDVASDNLAQLFSSDWKLIKALTIKVSGDDYYRFVLLERDGVQVWFGVAHPVSGAANEGKRVASVQAACEAAKRAGVDFETLVFGGDWNSSARSNVANSVAWVLRQHGLRDIVEVLPADQFTGNSTNSHHGFKPPRTEGKHLDKFFIGSKITARYGFLVKTDDTNAADHNWVVAGLTLQVDPEEPPMADYGPAAIKAIYTTLKKSRPKVTFSGQVGHNTGYHRSYRHNRKVKPNDYSIQASFDKPPRLSGKLLNAATGLDISANPTDMKVISKRLMDACKAHDPRLYRKHKVDRNDVLLRCWYGTLDGKKVTGYSPYRDALGSSDPTHLWHLHLEIARCYGEEAKLLQGIAEIMCGVPLEHSLVYKPALPQKPPAAPLPPSGLVLGFRGAVKVAAYNLGFPSHVKLVQTALKENGVDPGPIDGKKGKRTNAALIFFLKKWGFDPSEGKISFQQLDRLVWEAEKKKPGTQYPPRGK